MCVNCAFKAAVHRDAATDMLCSCNTRPGSGSSSPSRRFVMGVGLQEVEVEADASIDPTTWKVLGFVRPYEALHPAHAAK